MANRSLRRAYGGTETDSRIVSAGNDGDGIGESERADGITNADSIVNGDGEIKQQNTISDGGSIGVIEIDPAELTEYVNSGSNGSGDSGEPRKRRGRKPGSKNRTGSKKAQDTVAPFLLMVHQWAAVLLKTPELGIAEDEANKLNDAYCTFCEYHEVPILSPKRMSEINLIAAMCLVYGPRVIAIRNRHKETRKVNGARNVTEPTQPIHAVQ